MAEELGKIEKPEAERFEGERKLYLVPLLFAAKDSPPDYVEKFELYWQQVTEQIASQPKFTTDPPISRLKWPMPTGLWSLHLLHPEPFCLEWF